MSKDITITLSDDDLARFQESIDKGRLAISDTVAAQEIEEQANELIDKAQVIDLPHFISERLLKLQVLINMMSDDEWKLSGDERNSIRNALYYFVDADDVIPDHIPGIGFLDDAIYAEIVIQELRTEIRLYQEFCQFRIADETRRRDRGEDPYVGCEDWIAEKRSFLHSRMRERRALRSGGRGWRMRLL